MIRRGAGGYVAISAGETDALASPYAVPAWAATTEYKRDDQVLTASTDGTSQTKYWVAKDDHTAEAGDATGESASAAATLASAHWDEIDTGELIELVDWTLTRPVETTEGVTLLRESSPRSSNTPGAVTLALNYLDNFEGGKTQTVLAKPNTRVYVKLYPKGRNRVTPDDREQIVGYMVTGEWSETGTQGEFVSCSVTLTGDGDFTSSAQNA